MTTWKVELGNCLDVLKTMEPNSVNAVVTDPPYGLGDSPDMIKVLESWLKGAPAEITGKGFMGKAWDSFVPGPDIWKEVLRVLKPGGFAIVFAGSRTLDVMGLAVRLAGFELVDTLMFLHGQGFPHGSNVSKEFDRAAGVDTETLTTPNAIKWEGYRTQLKPAYEPILFLQKPLDGPIFRNCEKWGVGALNIDQCRIPYLDEFDRETCSGSTRIFGPNIGGDKPAVRHTDPNGPPLQNENGRYPATVLMDEGAALVLDSEFKSGGRGPSRFFYTSKATRGEREAGLSHLTPKKRDESRNADQPSMNGGVGNPYNRGAQLRLNSHPTVKPIDLMRWLVRLVKGPDSGVILDPFCGSGTTGIAAVLEGMSFVGIDMTPEYVEIARARIHHWNVSRGLFDGPMAESEQAPKEPEEAPQMDLNDLFGF